MKSVIFDEKLYKIVPIDAFDFQLIAGMNELPIEQTYHTQNVYDAMLAAIPDELPGVVMDTGEPAGYMVQASRAAQDGSMEDGPFSFVDATHASEYERRIGVPLFTHPAPAAIAIVKAVIEACADAVDNAGGSVDNAYRGHYYEAIYALSPETILSGIK